MFDAVVEHADDRATGLHGEAGQRSERIPVPQSWVKLKASDPRRIPADAIEAIRLIDEQITPFVAESSQAFVTGALSVDEGWDDYVLELEARGYKTMEEIWNLAWAKQRH